MKKRPRPQAGADAQSSDGEGSPQLGGSTRSVHGGERDHQATDGITTPIYQTSTFWFENSEKLRAFQEGRDQLPGGAALRHAANFRRKDRAPRQ